MLPDNPTLEEIEAVFANDRFATEAAGCRVVSGERGRAVCAMELADVHRNAMGNVMGGAIFTLADFALAVCCNIGEEPRCRWTPRSASSAPRRARRSPPRPYATSQAAIWGSTQ